MKIALTLTKFDTTSAINNAYIKYVQRAGYLPALFSIDSDVDKIAKMCNGLILKGGSDVEPTYYGEANASSIAPDPELDKFERKLLWAFVAERKPVFGICRGFQLIYREICSKNAPEYNIKGLTFKQSLSGHSQSANKVDRNIPFHFIDFVPKLYDWNSLDFSKGAERWTRVNSMHHQGVEKKKNFNKEYNHRESPIHILAWDGKTIEAFSSKEHKILAVQWHPEELMDVELLRGFFESEARHVIAGG